MPVCLSLQVKAAGLTLRYLSGAVLSCLFVLMILSRNTFLILPVWCNDLFLPPLYSKIQLIILTMILIASSVYWVLGSGIYIDSFDDTERKT